MQAVMSYFAKRISSRLGELDEELPARGVMMGIAQGVSGLMSFALIDGEEIDEAL